MIRCPQAGFGEWLRCRVDRSSRLRRLWKCRWPGYPFGFQQQEKLKDVYTVADMLVLPSLYTETWGLVMNEAMQLGVPCIVSDRVGCGPDLIRPGDTFHALCLKRVADYSVQTAADWILDKALYL